MKLLWIVLLLALPSLPSFTKVEKAEKVESKKVVADQYDRSTWEHWIDEDKDCQDLRAEILIATSQTPVTYRKAKGCVVATGRWYGEYTGLIYDSASKVDIDHVVPLKHAHDHGGFKWSLEQKRKFANDQFNLLAVQSTANRRKSAQGPHEWMPPLESYGCAYLERWAAIKKLYKLKVGKEEKKFIREYNKGCAKP